MNMNASARNQVMANPERLSKTAERVVEDFCWIQWDGHAQRLFYLTRAVAHTQACTATLVSTQKKAHWVNPPHPPNPLKKTVF